MKKQFVAFIALLGLSVALVGCNSQKTETTPSEEITVENTTSESSNETTTPEDETIKNEDSSTTEDSEDTTETGSTDTPSLEKDQAEEKVESKPEQVSKPNTSTSKPNSSSTSTNKPSTTTKPQGGTTTKPPTTTKPEASSKPEASTKPEAPTKPEASAKPEVPQTPETTSLSSSEVFSQITSGLELPTQMELDADLLMNLYGIDASLLESYCVKMPMMSFQITEIGVFKVKDANNVDSIVAGINKRAGDVGSVLYPSLQETFDSRVVVTKGNYILFAMDENASTIAANFNNLIK